MVSSHETSKATIEVIARIDQRVGLCSREARRGSFEATFPMVAAILELAACATL